MENPNSLNLVAEFHNRFRSPVLTTPAIPFQERVRLRISLLQEELDELKQAIADNNLVEVADGFCDLQYVLSGAILEFGMGDKFDALFKEVHRSNMSKACDTIIEARTTVESYAGKGEFAGIYQDGEKFVVYRVSDMKTLKSINYSPASLGPILFPGAGRVVGNYAETSKETRDLIIYPCINVAKCKSDRMLPSEAMEGQVFCKVCGWYQSTPTLEQRKSYIEGIAAASGS